MKIIYLKLSEKIIFFLILQTVQIFLFLEGGGNTCSSSPFLLLQLILFREMRQPFILKWTFEMSHIHIHIQSFENLQTWNTRQTSVHFCLGEWRGEEGNLIVRELGRGGMHYAYVTPSGKGGTDGIYKTGLMTSSSSQRLYSAWMYSIGNYSRRIYKTLVWACTCRP